MDHPERIAPNRVAKIQRQIETEHLHRGDKLMLSAAQFDRLFPRLNGRELGKLEGMIRRVGVAREKARGWPTNTLPDWITGRVMFVVWWAKWHQLAFLLRRLQGRHS